MIVVKPSRMTQAQIRAAMKRHGHGADVITATIPHVLTYQDDVAVKEGCWFNDEAAQRVVDFFECFLKHSKGKWAGEPFKLMKCQREDIIGPLFGWMRSDDTRRFRRAGIWVAKKNFKTTMAAGLILYGLVGDGEAGAEVYSAAADRNQAGILSRAAGAMVNRSPAMTKRLRYIPGVKKIINKDAVDSFYQALSAEYKVSEGLNWHITVVDELHVVSRELHETLRHGGANREQPLLITTSTAGFDRESIGFEEYEYARGVLEGTIEDVSFFGYIATADPALPIDSEEAIRQANPGLGETVRLEELQEAAREARNSPSKENAFRRYRLNQWTDAEFRWLPSDMWDRNAGKIDQGALIGTRCAGALDLSAKVDMTAFVLAFPLEDERFVLLPHFFLPEEGIENAEKRSGLPRGAFSEWVRRGYLTLTPGRVVDYGFVEQRVREAHNDYDLVGVGYDPWNAEQLAKTLDDAGVPLVEFRQGYKSMSDPSKEFERLIVAEKITHGGHPVLAWHAANTVVVEDPAGNIKPDKKKSGRKIDGIVASIMAIQVARSVETSSGMTFDVLDV